MTQSQATVITAKYRIVTPMFCAGADQNHAELRLASFKGALRFWWRSLMWRNEIDCHKLGEMEAPLFGSSNGTVGQSKIRIQLQEESLAQQIEEGEIFSGGRLAGAHYLGYGVMEAFDGKNTKAGRLTRAMIPGGEFTVRIRARKLSDAQQCQIKDALVLLGTVGGLGSKSRKGFGSLTIKSLEIDETNQPLAGDPAERLNSILAGSGLREQLPDWTAWSRSDELRVVQVVGKTNSASELLDAIGREQVHYRGWGSNRRSGDQHETLGLPSEQNFPIDHDLSKTPSEGKHPHRAAFGLPHNYRTGGVKPKQYDRRASPLFIHIDQIGESALPEALLAFLPARFLPGGGEITAFDKAVEISDDRCFWYPIHAFLDRLIADGHRPSNRQGYDNFPNDHWWKKKTSISGREVKIDT